MKADRRSRQAAVPPSCGGSNCASMGCDSSSDGAGSLLAARDTVTGKGRCCSSQTLVVAGGDILSECRCGSKMARSISTFFSWIRGHIITHIGSSTAEVYVISATRILERSQSARSTLSERVTVRTAFWNRCSSGYLPLWQDHR
jgi:hypothetical protein